MSKLWELNPDYRKFDPQSWEDVKKASEYPEIFLPYKRLYTNLTPEQLQELIHDAKQFHWEILDLRRCGLNFLPDELAELKDLRILSLGNYFDNRATSIKGERNLFSSLPDRVGQLTNLQALDLDSAAISELPTSIEHLQNLQSLDLFQTNITELPECIEQLTNLRLLGLGHSSINKLTNSIGKLVKLESLHIGRTSISEIPDFIRNLTQLRTLKLCFCHLKAIPYSVVELGLPFVIDNKWANNCVNLTGVTLDEGDLQLFAQPRDVIEAAYRERTAQAIKECKVIFLGDGAAGKSSLIERMVNNYFEKDSLPTDGVKMTKWKPPIVGNPYTLRFLDFGGQEIMHSMHRCFLTAHTVYVVVCESRDDPEIDGIAGRWLETVKAFAPDCPVILALSKCDLNQHVSVNERDLKARNPRLKCVLRTSAAAEPGEKFYVSSLLDEIMEEVPNCVSRITANRYMLAVKEKLENMTEDYISSERYREICKENHIDEETLQYRWLNYFKDLGVAYSYDPSKESDDIDTRLESIRVLNPAWLTNGIYRLILRTEENGFLPIKTIQKTLRATHAGDILRDKTYSKAETEFILHVMRKFEISHYIGGGVEMIPLKLPKTPPPTLDNFNKQNALHLRWEGAYLPNNLIHRLLIRKFPELDKNCVWRTGGHFVQEGGGCEALAEMNEKALNVYVNGERDCRQYLETFRRVIQAILTDLNLKVSEVICCTVDGQEGAVPYEDVVKQYYDKRDSIYIRGIPKYVNPAELLRDTYYNWEQEAARYRQRMGYEMFRAPEMLPEKEPETAPEKSELDKKKTLAEIEQIHSETAKNKSETRRNNLLITFVVALAVFIGTLVWLRPDMLEKLLEGLMSLPGLLS